MILNVRSRTIVDAIDGSGAVSFQGQSSIAQQSHSPGRELSGLQGGMTMFLTVNVARFCEKQSEGRNLR